MVQAEVADRLAARPRLEGLRRALGEGRLVGRRPPRRRRGASASSGRPPTSTPAWSRWTRRDPPVTTATREQVFAVVDAAFAQRRKTLRAALRGLAGSTEAAVGGAGGRGHRPRRPVARCWRSQSSSGIAEELQPVTAVQVRAAAKINLHLGVGRAASRRVPPARSPSSRPCRPLRRRHRRAGAPDWEVTSSSWPTTSTRRAPARRRQHRRPRGRRAGRATTRAPLTGQIEVHKEIPVAGGMAGGQRRRRGRAGRPRPALGRSSTSDADLLALAADLGQRRAVLAGGRHRAGRRVAASSSTPVADAGSWWWVVVPSAGDGLSTPAVYRALRPAAPRRLPRTRHRPACSSRRWRPATPAARARAAQRPRGGGGRPAPRPRRARSPPVRRRARCAGMVSGSGPTCVFLALRRRPRARAGRRAAARPPGRTRRHTARSRARTS